MKVLLPERKDEMKREMSDREKIEAFDRQAEMRKKHQARQTTRTMILLQKAREAGLTVSEHEIDQYLIKDGKKVGKLDEEKKEVVLRKKK